MRAAAGPGARPHAPGTARRRAMAARRRPPGCPLDQQLETAVLADAAADAAHAWLMQVRGVVCKDLQAATPLARESVVAAALNTVGRWRQSHEREAAALARRIDPRFVYLLAHAVRETRQSLSRTIGHPSLVVDGPPRRGGSCATCS